MNMLVALILVSAVLTAQTVYFLYYKRQIKDVGKQMDFISKHNSFKYVHIQIRSKEIYELVQCCNRLLQNKTELNQQFIRKHEEVNATIVSLSHDIRTPLTSLGGYLQLADSAEDLPTKSRYIQLARTRMKQMTTLVDELFYYTRLQNPEYHLEIGTVDVIDIVHKRLFAAFEDFNRKGLEPDVSRLPETPLLIDGNHQALERVFENAISNYFLHGEGRLSIRCEDTEDQVVLLVTNELKQGRAIQADRLFNRFYKGDPSRTLHSAGLGLSIVKSLMVKMSGSARVSLDGERFCLILAFRRAQGRKADGLH